MKPNHWILGRSFEFEAERIVGLSVASGRRSATLRFAGADVIYEMTSELFWRALRAGVIVECA